MKQLAELLERLGVTDDGYVSLTNLLTYVVLVKLVLAPTVGVGEIATLLGVLCSHLGHRVIDAKQPDNTQVKAVVEELQTKVAALQMGQQVSRR